MISAKAFGAGAPSLRKALNSWQIFFITLSGVIGTGIFSGDGRVLHTAGPGGYLLATGIIGLIAISFMDSLSELIQQFPCANALTEYVDLFVDRELAVLVGVAYWMLWGIYWALMINGAASYITFWTQDLGLRIPVFFIIYPALTIGINLCNVDLFGWIETFGGSLKAVAVVAVSLTIYYLAGAAGHANSNINDGLVPGDNWHSQAMNICAVLPLVAYSWIGLEIVAVTAYEAKRLKDLKVPSQAIVYFILLLYVICAVGECAAVYWGNTSLPAKRDAALVQAASNTTGILNSEAVVVIAATQVSRYKIANVFNGVLIFSALSAGNTCLYVASRSIYGLAINDRRRHWWGLRKLAYVNRYGVPMWSVLVTAAVFGWLPFLSLSPEPASAQFSQWLGTTANLSGLFVWGCVCLAYIRYWHWLYDFKNDPILTGKYANYNRFDRANRQASTLLGFAQPGLAYFGLTGTFLCVFVFSSAYFWISPATPFEVTQTFTVPVLLLISWVALKAMRAVQSTDKDPFRWYELLAYESGSLQRAIDRMELLCRDGLSDRLRQSGSDDEPLRLEITREAGAL